ncbi:3-hydroxyacyl-CoA dehydrogenase NAD-binding domain-containing protein [Paragemmobacter straminiformis]|uniref:Enoyl-CoA hydratase/isomerase family protein n=1 Tax=Paragemmobacter straminiformis TaxID=2045119 RepID=A0A842I777_9RHOB|nr:3-hydroxyacyl-CoA dehydrogenase NAD-binding domain-containing protein [Gemmobacter straminiformis]MBC2834838.1 enoyl-CoA hydratase/isomerase family protein [Gemmobacter straminiformis]
MPDFTLTTAPDGVATITWDVAGKSMNVLSLAGIAELDGLIDHALSDPAIRGIILTSAKPDFAGGMDLRVIAQMQAGGAQAVFDGVMSMHALLRKIERAGMDPKTLRGGKPIVAALPGTALGIGLELPLACHRIIAADTPRAKIGLPEIKVGIFPGAGGTTRLTRKLGAMAAAPFLLEGKLSDPNSARSGGLVDEVVPPETLLARARDWVLAASDADLVKPWDAKGYKMPGGTPYHPAGFMTFVGASAMVTGQTMGVYPAARAMLSAVYEGALVPFDTALKIEARWFTQILMDPTSSAMIRTLFINKEALEKGANRPALPDSPVRHLGVIGAGMMGAGIAHVAALAGITVTLVDATQEAAEKGRAHSETLLEKSVRRRKMTPGKMAETLARITPTTDYTALGTCDLIVEAVFEDPAVKAEVTRRAEAASGAIFATNTSTLPITALARASLRPDRFLGIHFFSPVDKMALVEIIRGKDTAAEAVAKALDFVRQLRKTPIVVNDARFFYANRCIIPYLNEGMRLVAEGVTPALIENAARMLGMPLGPLQLIDETSLDLGVRIARATRAAMGDAYPDGDVDAVLFRMADLGRMGKKAKAGFYAYDDTGKRLGLWSGLGTEFPLANPQPDLATVQKRLLYVQVLEAIRALEQGVLTDIREGDVGAILGWGFAPWSGGPFSWADRIGAGAVAETAQALADAHGPRFAPPDLLVDMAAKGETFYRRFAKAA